MTSGTGRVCVYLCQSTLLIFCYIIKSDYILVSPTVETVDSFRIVKSVGCMRFDNLLSGVTIILYVNKTVSNAVSLSCLALFFTLSEETASFQL